MTVNVVMMDLKGTVPFHVGAVSETADSHVHCAVTGRQTANTQKSRVRARSHRRLIDRASSPWRHKRRQ